MSEQAQGDISRAREHAARQLRTAQLVAEKGTGLGEYSRALNHVQDLDDQLKKHPDAQVDLGRPKEQSPLP